jgi:hypothetical protein
MARGAPPRPISRRYPPQPILMSPTAGEKEIHPRLRGHSKRVLLALRGTDYYYVQAFALEVLRGVDFAGRCFTDRPCWLSRGDLY